MTTSSEIEATLKRLRLIGCMAHLDEIEDEPWLARLIAIESEERARRSLENRTRIAGLGTFKSHGRLRLEVAEEDRPLVGRGPLHQLATSPRARTSSSWAPTVWPRRCSSRTSRAARSTLATRSSCAARATCSLTSPGRSPRPRARRRLRAYVQPAVLCIDEVGYLSYDTRHADLLFEVVTRRYEKNKSIVLSTNKPFAEWPSVFPNAACVVTLVDRLLHRAELVVIEGESYRLREAQERQQRRATARRKTKDTPPVPPTT